MNGGQFLANLALAVVALFVALATSDIAKTKRDKRIGYGVAGLLAAIPLFHVIVLAVAG